MNRVLHLLQHVAFVIFVLVLFFFLFVPHDTFHGAKYHVTTDFSSSDTGVSFYDSEHFNKMLGASLTEVIDLAGTDHYLDSDEHREAVSGNALKGTDSDLYEKSTRYRDYYDPSVSNFRYILIQGEGKNREVHTNYPEGAEALRDYDTEKLLKLSRETDKRYLYLNVKEHIFETDTRIDEKTVLYLFANSDYRFYDDTILIAGVRDLGRSPVINDEYRRVYGRYDLFTRYYWLLLITLFVSGFLYLALLFILSVREGVTYDKETKKPVYKAAPSDHVPAELRILLLAACVLPYVFAFRSGEIQALLQDLVDREVPETVYAVAVFALITSLVISFFWYGTVRRIKCALIYRTSLLCKGVDKVRSVSSDIYGHSGLFVRSFLVHLVICVLCILSALFVLGVMSSRKYTVLGLFAVLLLTVIALICMVTGKKRYDMLKEQQGIIGALNMIAEKKGETKVDLTKMHGDNVMLGEAVNRIGDSIREAVETSMKDEKMKADLITNVSHDLKTPLTSIINYVDLLKKEEIDNERARSYIGILDEKSQRLKQLTDDLVEASKISSGNIDLRMEKLNLRELLNQASGEFADKFAENDLTIVSAMPEEPVFIRADSRSIFRVIENLYTNICKYALKGTRVYTDVTRVEDRILLTIRNISATPLSVSPEELTERFIRGDEARTSEGSGLGLSIAKNLTEAMEGSFRILIDKDLFKVELRFMEEK